MGKCRQAGLLFTGALTSNSLNTPFASQIQYAATMLMASVSNSWKADHSLRDREGRTCLHHAAGSGNMDSVIQLLEAGCLVNAPDSVGHPVLCFATNAEVVDLLVRNSAEINQIDHHGATPLQSAIRRLEPADVIECYLRLGARTHAVENDGIDAFAFAIMYNHCEALEALIDAEKSCVRLNPYKCREWRAEATYSIAYAPASTRL